MKENQIVVKANRENIELVFEFIENELKRVKHTPKFLSQINIIIDEIYSNIANYAYKEKKGNVIVKTFIDDKASSFGLKFIDTGVPYNPLKRKNPDVKKPAIERKIGGLGIFITKKLADDIKYEYKDNQNILTIKKFYDR